MTILNAFSLNMLATFPSRCEMTEISLEKARGLAVGLTSGVGHADTARIFEILLGHQVPCNRVTVSLAPGDSVLVGQYRGPRLPEGATELPQGATIQWVVVTVS